MHRGAAGKGELPGKAKGSGLIALPPIRHPLAMAKLLAPLSLALARALAIEKTFMNMSNSAGDGPGLGLASVAGAKQRAIRKKTMMVRELIILEIA